MIKRIRILPPKMIIKVVTYTRLVTDQSPMCRKLIPQRRIFETTTVILPIRK